MRQWAVTLLATLYMVLGSALAGHGVLQLLGADRTGAEDVLFGALTWGIVHEWLTQRATSEEAREVADRFAPLPLFFVIDAALPAIAFAFGW